MINNKKIIVVMPAYNAEKTYSEIPFDIVDDVVLTDDFSDDNTVELAKKYEIGELTSPTKYFKEASSINLWRSSIYGLGVLKVSLIYRLAKMGLLKNEIFN